jgi:hypothetical protein
MDQSFWRVEEGGLPGCGVGTVIAIVREGTSARVLRDGVQIGTLQPSTTQQTNAPDNSSITLVNETEGWRAVLSRASETPGVSQAASASQSSPSVPIWPCPRCGVPQPSTTRFCANCGQPLAAAAVQPTPVARPAPRRTSVTTRVVLGLIGLIVVITAINMAAVHSAQIPGLPPAQPPAAAVTLLNTSGSGLKNTAPFAATGDHLAISYAYDCSGFGQSGNFIVNLNNASGLVAGVANELGAKGQSSSAAYFNGASGPYHLEIDSECSWNVIVFGEP